MSERRPLLRTVATALALAAGAALVPANPASAATFPNVCISNLGPAVQVAVTMTADSPASTGPGDSVPLTNIQQSFGLPGELFLAGYNLGLFTTGLNTIQATVVTKIEATNTIEGTQDTNAAATSISTTITDPDGEFATGDETATPGPVSVIYNDQTWTAGPGGTIDFREAMVPLGIGTGALHTGGIKITTVIGGFLEVRLACSRGEPVSFATTEIQVVTQPPSADAGPDQTVASGAVVNLDGTGSVDPDGDTLTYAWTQTGGPAVTLTGANTATPSFTAPTGPATLQFELTVTGDTSDTDSVVVTVEASTIAALMDAIEALDLRRGIERSLLAKLDGAQRNLDADDLAAACEKLASFIYEVAAQSAKAIGATDAAELVDGANAVRESLGCDTL